MRALRLSSRLEVHRSQSNLRDEDRTTIVSKNEQRLVEQKDAEMTEQTESVKGRKRAGFRSDLHSDGSVTQAPLREGKETS